MQIGTDPEWTYLELENSFTNFTKGVVLCYGKILVFGSQLKSIELSYFLSEEGEWRAEKPHKRKKGQTRHNVMIRGHLFTLGEYSKQKTEILQFDGAKWKIIWD